MTDKIIYGDIQHWFKHYASDLKAFFRRRSGEPDAPDLVQEVYLKLLSQPSVTEIREPRAFLFRIAANLAVDHARKQAYRNYESDDDLDEWVPAEAPGPEQAADDAQQAQRLCAALAELPIPCRDAFLLNRFDGLNHSEIAERMGVSVKTVQRYIGRAFEHCSTRLAS